MADLKLGILLTVWRIVDARLAQVAASLQRVLRTLRWVRFLLVVGVIAVAFTAVIGIMVAFGRLPIAWFFAAYAVSSVFVVIPLGVLLVLTSLPFKAQSVIRLIDQGYPDNARELAIRILARKLHDQSIESEELLLETAINEGKKVWRRVQDSQSRGAGGEAADEGPEAPGPAPAGAAAAPPPPPGGNVPPR